MGPAVDGTRIRTAPCSAVLITVVPAARQRATTSARGIRQRFPKPADAMPTRADTASISAGDEEVALP